LADLEGLIEHFPGTKMHLIIPVLGWVKGEHHSEAAPNSVRKGDGFWDTDRHLDEAVATLAIHQMHHTRTRCPHFVNKDGFQSTTSAMNDLFLEALVEVFKEHPELSAIGIKTTADLFDKYKNVFRSFRRGSESQAVAMKVSEPDRYVVHRWKRK
jgi:hypothetical protein